MIVDLFKSRISLAELSCEYGIKKSTLNDLIKDLKEIKRIYGVPRIHHILRTKGFKYP